MGSDQPWTIATAPNGIDIDITGMAAGTYSVSAYTGNVINSEKLVTLNKSLSEIRY